jgi:excinuclease UvrABC ATPase subunit
MKNIIIKGAREHNLKNISVTIPRDQFIVITGLSGSGNQPSHLTLSMLKDNGGMLNHSPHMPASS